MRTINDWQPETRSLLKTLRDAGFTIVSGDNGEESFAYVDEQTFIEQLTACDESHLYVRMGDGPQRWLYLVYGNSPGELVSDYSISSYEAQDDTDRALDKATMAHSERWETRKQPTIVEL